MTQGEILLPVRKPAGRRRRASLQTEHELDVSDPDRCYRALRSRDAQFDRLFFVAVTTFGVLSADLPSPCRSAALLSPFRPRRRGRERWLSRLLALPARGRLPTRGRRFRPRLLRVGLRKIRRDLNEPRWTSFRPGWRDRAPPGGGA